MNPSTVYPPLNSLRISPLNQRTNDTSSVEELAALIKSQGLLQNLVVVREVAKKGKDLIAYGVVAGGRRLRAMQLLAERGDLELDYPVPCRELDASNAEEASVAENDGREPMHPADEFLAFKRWHAAGLPIEDIAAKFGVSPIVVRRRLKLANVSPKLIEFYRAGEMKLDQVTALSITDDHKLQEKTWDKADSWGRSASRLRERLTDGMVSTRSDEAAKFVGIAAYEAAGGAVVRDLFAGPDDGYMGDKDLLKRLFIEKLEGIADGLRAEGWAWVIAMPTVDHNDTYKYGRSKPTARELTVEEKGESDALRAELVSLNDRVEKLEDDENADETVVDDLNERVEAIEARLREIKASVDVYSDRQKKKAGVMLGLNYSGVLEIHRGLLREENKPKSSSGSAAAAPAEKVAHSETLVRKLSAHRTLALQASLADCHRLALAFLCSTMAKQVFYGKHSTDGHRVSITPQTDTMLRMADDAKDSRAWQEMNERREDLRSRMPDTADNLLAWLEEQPLELVMEILAFCTSTCVDAIQHHELSHAPFAGDLAGALGLDMSGWWTATADSYFKHVRKDVVIAAVVDAGADAKTAATLEKLKKGQLDVQAELLLKDAGWLPSVLRSAEPPAKKPAPKKEAPAKKAAKPPASKRKPAHPDGAPIPKDPPPKSGPDIRIALNPAAAWPFPKQNY